MTRPVQRVGDPNSAGGIGVLGHPNITVNGRLMMKKMSPVTPHPCCGLPGCFIHCVAQAALPGSMTVTANGVRVLRDGDRDTCLHARVAGSHNVVCGG